MQDLKNEDGKGDLKNIITDPSSEKIVGSREEIIDWAKHIGIAIVIAFLITRFVIVNAHIPTPSMEPTIMVKDRVIASRIHYLFTEPKRGDIVVFKFPDDESVLYVKRIIGLPGETVVIKDGSVLVNGNKIDEPYIKTTILGNSGPFQVPEGKYFMLGDNRNNSKDSRFWNNKFVSKEKILGKTLFKYFPFPFKTY